MASNAERIVGREEELARIVRALDGLAEAGPRLIEISGEPGIGKTRLLQELCDEAESRGYLVLRGNAAEFERGVPFASVVDAMDAYLATVDPDRLGDDAELRGELGAIFPSLRDPDDEEAVAGVGDERHRAWRAVRDLLARLAAERPLVIALDDLQWADDATVEVIASLLAKPPETRVLLALAQRAGRAHPKLEGALGSVERRRGAHRFRLGPLDAAEANELLEGSVDEPLRHSLFEAGGGNPFFMQQLARVTAESGPDSLSAGALDELDLPPAVAAALAEEIASLPEGTRRLVEAASVAGERFEPDLMADIAQATEDEALAAVDELLERDIVKPTDVPRRFAFRHPLVWRAVYEGAPGGWRLAAHRRAADALRGRRAPAAERAHHVEHAARRGDEDAVHVLAEAGRATAAQTPASAARWLRAALRLLPDGPGHAEHRAALLVELAATLRGAGELESCRGSLMEALAHLPPDAVAERVRIEADCASVEGWLGRPADAHRRLTRAREDLDAEGTPEAVLLDTRLSLDALYALDFDCHERCGMRALEAARTLGDPALISEAAAAQSVGEAVGARVAAAREHREESVAALERLDDQELAGRLEIFYYLAWAENYIQEPELALTTAERGLAASRAAGQGHLLVPLQLARVFPLQMLGRLAEAIEKAEEALEAARTSPNPQYLFWALWECAYAHLLAGGLERALLLFDECIPASEGLARNFLSWPQPGATYGGALIESGEHERGLATVLEGIGGPDAPMQAAFERPITWLALVEHLVEQGQLEEAELYVERSETLAAELNLELSTALAAHARAALLLASGRPEEALAMAQEGRALALDRGLRLDGANLRKLEGEILLALERRDESVAVLRDAERMLDELPSVRARDAVRRELRSLGVRTEPRRGGAAAGGDEGLASLSAREREIAELVTDRKTNREIAEELFLSQKTIETHLRNVFFKLGVTSRVEVARLVERERSATS